MRPKKFFILATLSTLIPIFSMNSYSKGTELAQNKLNNINDENNNFNRLNIDSRKILKRGIKPQRKSMLWPGSQDHLDFNKYWPSRFHEIKGLDKQELYNENQKLNNLVKDYYVGGGTSGYFKWNGYHKLYSGYEIPSDATYVQAQFSFFLNGQPHPTGLYADPGEPVNIYLPINFKDRYLKVDNTPNDNLTFTIGQLIRNGNGNETPADKITTDVPLRTITYTLKEVFNPLNTVVLDDGQQYYKVTIGSPIGGPIYVQTWTANNQSLDLRIDNAFEGWYYNYGSTTNEDWAEMKKYAVGQYFDFSVPLLRLSGPFYKSFLDIDDIERVGKFWENVVNISWNFAPSRNMPIVNLYDSWVNGYAGLAVQNAWYTRLIVDAFPTAFNYDLLMSSTSDTWVHLHELNHHYEHEGGRACATAGQDDCWGDWPSKGTWEVGNNVISVFEYSLLTNTAMNRNADKNEYGMSGWSWSVDPFTTLSKIYKKRFQNNLVEDSLELYASIFHSNGFQILKDTHLYDWSRGGVRGDYDFLYTNLTQKSGLDFYDYLKNVLHYPISENAKNDVSKLLCLNEQNENVDCNYPSFDLTASIYTMANERVDSLEQWRKDIKKNVYENGLPSYQDDDESSQSQLLYAGFKQNNKTQTAGTRYFEKSRASAYKRNTTGRPYVVSSNENTLLDFNFKLDENNNPTGNLLSTSNAIESVKLEWQEGEAISDNGDNTYTFNPHQTSNQEYKFAVSVSFKQDPNLAEFKPVILHGVLHKNGSEISNPVYALTPETKSLDEILTSNNNDPKLIDQSYSKIKKYYTNSSSTSKIENLNGDRYLSVLSFDFIAPTSSTYSFVTSGGIEAEAFYLENGKYISINEIDDQGVSTSKNISLESNQRLTMVLFALVNSTNPYSEIQYKEVSTKDLKSCFNNNEISPLSSNTGEYHTINGSNIANVGLDPFSYSDLIRWVSFTTRYNDALQIFKSNFTNTTPPRTDVKISGMGWLPKTGRPESIDEYDSYMQSNPTAWQLDGKLSEKDQTNFEKNTVALYDNSVQHNDAKDPVPTGLTYTGFKENLGSFYLLLDNQTSYPIKEFSLTAPKTKASINNPNEIPPFHDDFNAYKPANCNIKVENLLGDIDIFGGNSLNSEGLPQLDSYSKIGSSSNTLSWNTLQYNVRNANATQKISTSDNTYYKYYVIKFKSVKQSTNATGKDVFQLADINYSFGQTSNINLGLGNRYSVNDQNFNYQGNWVKTPSSRGVNGWALQGTKDATIDFWYYGNDFVIEGRKGPIYGTYEVEVDGQKYVGTSYGTSMLDNQTLALFNLKEGPHRVKIKVTSETPVHFSSIGVAPGDLSYKYIKSTFVPGDNDAPSKPVIPQKPVYPGDPVDPEPEPNPDPEPDPDPNPPVDPQPPVDPDPEPEPTPDPNPDNPDTEKPGNDNSGNVDNNNNLSEKTFFEKNKTWIISLIAIGTPIIVATSVAIPLIIKRRKNK